MVEYAADAGCGWLVSITGLKLLFCARLVVLDNSISVYLAATITERQVTTVVMAKVGWIVIVEASLHMLRLRTPEMIDRFILRHFILLVHQFTQLITHTRPQNWLRYEVFVKSIWRPGRLVCMSPSDWLITSDVINISVLSCSNVIYIRLEQTTLCLKKVHPFIFAIT